MNHIDFTNLGGFPLEQDKLKFMQDNYADAFSSIAKLCGDKTILTGVVKAAGLVSDGWIVYGGELIKFVGGAYADQVVISETSVSETFEDDTEHPVYFTKIATCGVAGSFPFTDLKPLSALKDINSVPQGLISMWSGAIANIPAGWALCDGTNGTPNLSGRFISGYDAADADYNAIGKTGGAKSVILTKAQLPAVGLKILNPFGGTDPYLVADTSGGGTKNSLKGDNDNSSGNGYLLTENMGSGQAIDKRPAFYTLAYIIKL